ncbi:MAG: glucose-6-phosphate isomerase [Planctomycetota bacterium]|nr:glucose-6-phosphate isomerase [Planctomycetota bacterium]
MDTLTLWRRYKELLCDAPSVGISLDISRMTFEADFLAKMEPALAQAFDAMHKLEAGEIANPDENRMVGHYWLRAPHLAPSDEITLQIEQTLASVRGFAEKVHSGEIKPPQAAKYTELLIIGIGGSALGPQLVADALGTRRDKLNVFFLDNTDPDGFDRVLESLGARVKSTLVVVISKSGGTKETRNGMVEAEHLFAARGLKFAEQAVAVTGDGSLLDQTAKAGKWLATFPMWDWVGGRTSIMSAVGLLPAALQGLDVLAFLDGAAEMDRITRQPDVRVNPAARLALMWHVATEGKGAKDMVILPYKDRLLLMSRYLQQLVMESLGKETDLAGNVVNQGISVFGNKGSTDQHAYVQQLREGVNNFFATFLVVQHDRTLAPGRSDFEVEPGVTSGDYLLGFWQGTRQALFEKGRQSVTIAIEKLDARSLGAIIALYERTVGLYATLVNINAYHQPGVEAGKKAATAVLDVQAKLLAFLPANPEAATAEQIADRMGMTQQVETIYHILEHLAANKRGVVISRGKYRWAPRGPRKA